MVVGGGLGSCAEFCIVKFTSYRGAFRCVGVLFVWEGVSESVSQ